jgi:hypothetical protein
MEQDSWDRTGGTGKADRTGGIGQIGQGNRDGTSWQDIPHSGYGSWERTTETGQPGQVNLDQTAGQVSLGR